MRNRIAAVVGAMALMASAPLAAQTCSTNPCTVAVTANATVGDILQLTLSSTTTNLGDPTAADFSAGHLSAAGPSTTVIANRPYHVDVVGAAANFSYVGAYGVIKPASDLKWGTSAGSYTNNMGTSAQLMGGNATAGASQNIFFDTQWNVTNDGPGAYSLVVNFTASAP